jgi:hypothetical protein
VARNNTYICCNNQLNTIREFGVRKLMLEWDSRDFDMKDAKSSKNIQKHIIWSKDERLQVDMSVGRVDCFE